MILVIDPEMIKKGTWWQTKDITSLHRRVPSQFLCMLLRTKVLHFVLLPWSFFSSFTAFLGSTRKEPSRDCTKSKARWGYWKIEMEPSFKGSCPRRNQVISDKHQTSPVGIHSPTPSPHSTLYLNSSLFSCMEPLEMLSTPEGCMLMHCLKTVSIMSWI